MPEAPDRGVALAGDETVDRALKRLKSKLDTEGILEEMRRRRAFETPIERSRRKARSAPKRNKIRWQYHRPKPAEDKPAIPAPATPAPAAESPES